MRKPCEIAAQGVLAAVRSIESSRSTQVQLDSQSEIPIASSVR